MLYDIFISYILVSIIHLLKKKQINNDKICVIRHTILTLHRFWTTSKLISNTYTDISQNKFILLPEISILFYDLYKEFNIEKCIHHYITFILILLNFIGDNINKNYSIHIGVNVLNMHSMGDISIFSTKVLNKSKNKLIKYISSVLGLCLWIYTRNILIYNYYFNILWKLGKYPIYIVNISKFVLIVHYIMGLYFTKKIILYAIKSLLKTIDGTPGTNQIPFIHFMKYISCLIYNNKYNTNNYVIPKNNDYNTVIGSSCRQLFNSFIIEYKKQHPNKRFKIGVSPIHHTSIIQILENNFNSDEIIVFDIDKTFENITIPQDKENVNYDLLVITHVLGKSLNIDDVLKRKSKNTLLIEDVILSNPNYKSDGDLIFYSSGIDKNPPLVFGGYVDIKTKHTKLIDDINSNIVSLPKEKLKDHLKRFYENIILYTIYNTTDIQLLIKLLLKFIGKPLSDIVKYVRTNVRGFNNDKFMKRPNDFIVREIINYKDKSKINVIDRKFIRFISNFNEKELNDIFPWIKEDSISHQYNPIYIDNEHKDILFSYFDSHSICIIQNPTYKTFQNQQHIDDILQNIYYIPSLYNLSLKEINKLAEFVKYVFHNIK